MGHKIKRLKNIFLPLIYAFIFILFFFLFYPMMISIHDEAGYIGMTYTLKKNTIYPEKAGLKFTQTFEHNNHTVFKHPFGWPMFLIPFSYDPKILFCASFFYFIAGYFFYLQILKKFQISLSFGYLYLFFPPFVIFSRTIMADLPSGVFLLIGMYFFLLRTRASLLVSGFCFGASISMRYPNIIILTIFIISLLLSKNKKNILFFLTGALPWGLAIILYNYFSYSRFFYGDLSLETGYFTSKFFLKYLSHYLLSLVIIYPLLPAALFLNKKPLRYEILIASISLLLFYSCWYFFWEKENFIQTLIIGSRYIIPAFFLLIPYYPLLIEKICISRTYGYILKILLPLFLIIACFYINFEHYNFSKLQLKYRMFLLKNYNTSYNLILLDRTKKLILFQSNNKKIFFDNIKKCRMEECYVATFRPDSIFKKKKIFSVKIIAAYKGLYILKTFPYTRINKSSS